MKIDFSWEENKQAFIYIAIFFTAFGLYRWYVMEEWRGFFYPNKYDLTEHVETGVFDSLEACRDHTIAYGEDRGIPASQFDYECGLDCKSRDGGYLCKETLR